MRNILSFLNESDIEKLLNKYEDKQKKLYIQIKKTSKATVYVLGGGWPHAYYFLKY